MRTLGDVSRQGAASRGDSTAIVFEETRFDYQEFDARINRLANALIELGCNKGDRLAILAENTYKYMEVYLGAAKAGLCVAPLNLRLSDSEIAHIVSNAEATVFFVGDGYEKRAASLRDDLATVATWIALDGTSDGYLLYEDLLAAAGETDPMVAVDEEDMAVLMYTGGTTGLPKGVMLSHKNLLTSARACGDVIDLNHDDVECFVLPLFHIAMWAALCTIMVGGTLVAARRPDLEHILALIEKERCTHVNMVPTLLGWLLSLPNLDSFDLSSLRILSYGGSPMAPEVLRTAMRKFGNIFVQGYGMTEAAPAISFLSKEDHAVEGPRQRLLASAGRAAPGVEIRVVDDNDASLPPGEDGEICVRGDNVMLGYWNNPELTAEALRGGWLHTGDMGFVDKQGYLFLMDRKADMIVTGGENVYPKEIEDVLYEHPAVQECAVVSAPDKRWGERVHAVVVLKAGQEAREDELIEYCKGRLAGYKCPKVVDIWQELPKTPIGKILRKDVKQHFWRGYG